jgi:glycosyltransferase involved in cell wall biosynthesis
MSTDTFIIVTARNEADRIEATLRGLAAAFPGAPVWVADDGSHDETASLARGAGAVVVASAGPQGKGGAASRAAERALERLNGDGPDVRADTGLGARSDAGVGGYVVAILCDGDLGESAAKLAPLAEAVRERQADLAVAAFARRVGGGLGLALGFARFAIKRRCGLDLSAPISGQRAVRADALGCLLPFAPGFGMEIGMTIAAARAGMSVQEVELDLSHRATGKTAAGFLHRARQLRDFVKVYRATAA